MICRLAWIEQPLKEQKCFCNVFFFINLILLFTHWLHWLNSNVYTAIQRTVCRAALFCFISEWWKKEAAKNDSVLRFNGSYGSYHHSFRCTRLSARIYSFPIIIEKISTIPFLTFSFRKKMLKIEDALQIFTKNTPHSPVLGFREYISLIRAFAKFHIGMRATFFGKNVPAIN